MKILIFQNVMRIRTTVIKFTYGFTVTYDRDAILQEATSMQEPP